MAESRIWNSRNIDPEIKSTMTLAKLGAIFTEAVGFGCQSFKITDKHGDNRGQVSVQVNLWSCRTSSALTTIPASSEYRRLVTMRRGLTPGSVNKI